MWLRRFYATLFLGFKFLGFYVCGVSEFNFVEGFAVLFFVGLKAQSPTVSKSNGLAVCQTGLLLVFRCLSAC